MLLTLTNFWSISAITGRTIQYTVRKEHESILKLCLSCILCFPLFHNFFRRDRKEKWIWHKAQRNSFVYFIPFCGSNFFETFNFLASLNLFAITFCHSHLCKLQIAILKFLRKYSLKQICILLLPFLLRVFFHFSAITATFVSRLPLKRKKKIFPLV